MDRWTIPEISPQDLHKKLVNSADFIILDVREPSEVKQVYLDDLRVQYVPLSILASEGLAALPANALNQDVEIVVLCHHGVRSAQVTVWLKSQGWQQIFSLRGGIDAYALLVDPSIGRYYS